MQLISELQERISTHEIRVSAARPLAEQGMILLRLFWREALAE